MLDEGGQNSTNAMTDNIL